MANQQLIDYVNQSRRAGVIDEQIRQKLASSGWSVSDIQDALGGVLIKKRRKLLYKIGFILLIVFVLISGTTLAFGLLNNSKNQSRPETPIANQPTDQTNPPTVNQVAPNSDIERVKTILEDIKQGLLTGNSSLVIKHATALTTSVYQTGKLESVNSFTVNNVFQSGSNIVANVTTISIDKTETENFVFVKENGDWKFDLKASIQWEKDQNNAKKGAGDPNGLPDLVVTKVTVYPSHPIVNSKDVRIEIAIKNIGTKTSDNGASLVAELTGSPNYIPWPGGFDFPIAPGETIFWNFNPYKDNDFFKISDTPGQKTIQVTLNKRHEIIESKYDNNFFTQTIDMYAN